MAPQKSAPEGPAPRGAGPFPCAMGDVVLWATGGESWLSAATIFHEDGPVAALFRAPEAFGDHAVYARLPPRLDLWRLAPAVDLVPAVREPPSVLHAAGRAFTRVRRLPVDARPGGEGPFPLPPAVVLGEYTDGAAARLLLVTAPGLPGAPPFTAAFLGEEVPGARYEVVAPP